MPRRRSWREKFEAASDTEVGLAWYGHEAFERLREVADDREKLDSTLED